MAELSSRSPTVSIQGLDEIVEQVLEDIRSRGQSPEFATGIPLLDQEIWGLHRSELCVIAARPGEGKTCLSLQIAKTLADAGKKVLFLSLEMTRHQLAERLLVQLTQFDAWSLRTGQDREAFFAKVEPLKPMLGKLNLRLVDGSGYTIDEVQHVLNLVLEKGGGPPDVLIIDFVQLIRLEGGMQRFDAIAEYLRAVKEMTMRYGMAALVCSQLNREAVKAKQPLLSQLKGSGAIEELADCVIICHWEELGTQERPEGYKYSLIIAKQRHGSPGAKIPVKFDRHKLTFHPVEEAVKQWVPEQEVKAVFEGAEKVE